MLRAEATTLYDSLMTLALPLTTDPDAGLGEPTAPQAAPSRDGRRTLLDESPDALKAWLAERGQPPMRVSQIRKNVLANRSTTFDDMTDLPKTLRAELGAAFSIFSMDVERHLTASDGTQKLLLKLHDGKQMECVLIPDDNRATACISTQVGCGMGCVFCASGLNGVARNLTSGEILEQMVRLRNLTVVPGAPPKQGHYGKLAERLTHVVVMGMGEPLANLDNLLSALAVAGDAAGLGIGARHITISTVGLPAKIRKLADLGKQYHLAVSLHAPNETLRTEIVPTNAKTGIDEILSAADYFFRTTGRQVTFEYVVLGGTNDQPIHAKQLAGLLKGRKAHVNLIPWNAVDGLPFRKPMDDNLTGFIDTLKRAGVSVTTRQRKGADIDAACGQLRRRAEQTVVAS